MKMTISQVARLAGVGVETVRFYEREGLLDQPARPDTGYRQYSLDVVKRIQFIKRAKELGFSLKEIGELLTLSVEPTSSCAEVKRQAEAKIAEIEGKIVDLLRMKHALGHIAERCSGDGPRERCPILDALGRDS
jgi:MerR family mercuric resistance operon transcriptional regulator